MNKKAQLKPINTLELEFKDKSDFLAWRKKILEEYEKSKIEYKEEMQQLFGFDKGKELWHSISIIKIIYNIRIKNINNYL